MFNKEKVKLFPTNRLNNSIYWHVDWIGTRLVQIRFLQYFPAKLNTFRWQKRVLRLDGYVYQFFKIHFFKMFHPRCKHWISSKQRSRPTYTENRIMLLVYITKYLWPCYGVVTKLDTSGLSSIDVVFALNYAHWTRVKTNGI